MDKNLVTETLKKIRESSAKRNFKQSIDLIINLKGLDLKKTESQIEFFLALHNNRDRKTTVCAFVGPELLDQAKQVCDKAIAADEFIKYTDKKVLRKLARSYDYFIAQATIMPKVASVFGRFLGTIGKMPNPKAGCVVPPNANLKQLCDKLQSTIKISIKKEPIFQCRVGYEDSNDELIIDNVLTIYTNMIKHLPREQYNIKSTYLKTTMGNALKIEEEKAEKEEGKKKKSKVIKKKPIVEKKVDENNR